MAQSKRFRFEGASPISKEISETLRSGSAGGSDLNLELIELEKIEPDPENPRKMNLSKVDVMKLREEWREDDASVREDSGLPVAIQKLLGMADTIGKVGVQQPIKVYRHGDRFRILLGERRYWASMLAGEKTVPAWILGRRPKALRALQFIENFQRDGLSLGEKIENIRGLSAELEQNTEHELTSALLAKEIGVSERQARKYLAVMRGPSDVLLAIADDFIKSLDVAAEISAIEDREERARAIAASASGSWEAYQKRLSGRINDEPAPEALSKKAGRRATQVTLGTTRNTALIREIVKRIAGDAACADVDWNDYGSINAAWKNLLKSVEREL